MNKKLISTVVLATMVFGNTAVAAFAADNAPAENEPLEIASYEATNDEVLEGVPSITVGDVEVDLSKLNVSQYIYDADDTVLVPLRAVAEQMGYAVAWDNDTRSIVVEDNDWKVSLAIGQDSYYGVSKTAIGMTAPMSYGHAPQIIEGTTYVPANMFELVGYSYNAIGQFVNFEK